MYSKLVSLAFILSLAVITKSSPIIKTRGDGPGAPYVCNPSCQERKRSLRNMGADAQGTWMYSPRCASSVSC